MHEHAPTATHRHAAGLDACLDLINTLELTDGLPVEGLATTAAALAFLEEHDAGHAEDLGAQARRDGEAWLTRVHAARAASRELWDARVEDRSPATVAITMLNALLECGTGVVLRATPAGVEVSHRHSVSDPTGEALARLVMPLVEAIAAGDTDRFRICANDGCRWVFEDASRAGRRRWCDMATCGNRAKVRRFRSRQREEPDETPPAIPAIPANSADPASSANPADPANSPAG